MKIDIYKIPPEGLILEEAIAASVLELETDSISFRQPVKVRAQVSKITNSISVHLALEYTMRASCSRCLIDADIPVRKEVHLNYIANKSEPRIDLDPDIRDEIMLDYPIKPLCKPDCRGLCPQCGKNLNEGKCDCVY